MFLDIKQALKSSNILSLFDTKVKFGWRRTREFKNKTFGTQYRGVPNFRQDLASIWTGKAKKQAYLYEFPILESISTCTHNWTDTKIQIRVVGRWTVYDQADSRMDESIFYIEDLLQEFTNVLNKS